jgi:hypothetical protein
VRSATDGFTGRLSDNGTTITGRWERLDDEKNWMPWMEITLTRDAN